MRGQRAVRLLRRAARGAARKWNLRAAEGALKGAPLPRKLHLGCGTLRFNGWINVDRVRLPSVDLCWDLRRGVPGEANSASFIYCEHFLEHLAVDDGVHFLEDCRRVLMPGGVLRIAMPSLDFLLERSVSADWAKQDWLTWPAFAGVKTRAEMINMAFRWWGHQWLYDREELYRRLGEAGFKRFVDVQPGQSNHPELRVRESRKDSLLVCEATK